MMQDNTRPPFNHDLQFHTFAATFKQHPTPKWERAGWAHVFSVGLLTVKAEVQRTGKPGSLILNFI